ncbi:tyrosine-type recombinase/integrase [Methylobacterium sp. Leaf99]|uniref:tyrosine-type recombinase/integrase n=1 Tax=Methylobacterium sp. Leaf99 TaxID=1736251 RepID=UPI001FCCD5FB|nr:tyrosine-type recombinase/integrase [Methylobacterium sp. Leaf99]
MEDYLAKRHGTAYEDIRHDHRMPREAHEAFWSPVEHEAFRILKDDPTKPRRLLSDALAVYLKEHDKGGLPKFAGDTERAIGHVFSIVGDFPLNTYRRDHAVSVRDGLLKGGNKTATARRRLNTIKAVFNKGLIEFNMGAHRNPFEKLTIAKEAQDAKEREPFTLDELKVIAEACRIKDDDIRHIVALQADTGARLGEIVGLRAEDVVLEHETPHIRIRPHVALGRTLKTVHSERDVPLVGVSLWAAERAVKASQGSAWLFPRYAENGNVKANNASQTVNKWLSKTMKLGKTTHSFRHAMRDRLRHAGVPEEFQNLIGGWGSRTIGQGYGSGYLLRQIREQIGKVV